MSWKTLSPESETYSYGYFSNEYVCRICWCQNAEKEIHSMSSNKLCENVTFAEKLLECTGVDLTSPGPSKICSDCGYEIENLYEFRRFCCETQRKLHDILQTIPQKEEISIEYDDPSEDLMTVPIENLLTDLNSHSLETKPQQKRAKRIRTQTYCTSCKISLNSEEEFSEHNFEFHRIDVQNGLYKCFGCEKVFSKKLQMLRHERESCKALENGYKCRECEKFLPKRGVFEKHLRNHRENVDVLVEELFNCRNCEKKFDSKELLKEHMTTHAAWRDKNNWVCDTCGRVFSRRDYLYKHKLMHDGRKQHVCPHCGFKTVQKSSLTVHIRKHTGERPYSCDVCPQRCVNSSNLREHRKRHFGIKQFECKLCDKKFGYKISLEEHISSIHERSELHNCAECGATYSRYRGLRRHLLSKHGKQLRKKKEMTKTPVEIEPIDNGNTTEFEVLPL